MKMNKRFLWLVGGLWAFIGLQAQDLRPMANDKGKFGYVDAQGKKVISYKYAEAYPFEEGLAKVRKGDKYGFIDPEGDEVGKIKYTVILPFTGSYCRVAVGGKYKEGILTDAKWGFLNKRGEEILKPEYDEIGEFENGFTYVLKGKKYGVINERAEFLLEPKYVAVGTFDEFGHCWFTESGKINKKTGKLSGAKYGIINKEGKIVVPAKYGSIGYFYNYRVENQTDMWEKDGFSSDSYNKVSLEKPLSRLYNPQNMKTVLLKEAKSAEQKDSLITYWNSLKLFVSGDYFYYSKNGSAFESGVMDKYGEIIIPEKKFTLVYCPSDGIAKVAKMRKKVVRFGHYNIGTGFLKEYATDEFPFSYVEGVAKIWNDNKKTCYFVNKSGRRITEDYRHATNFDKGACLVQSNTNGKFGVINPQGEQVVPMEYDGMLAYFSDDLLCVSKAGKWGAIDRKGEVVIPLAYKGLGMFTHGWAVAVNKAGKYGLITRENKRVIPFEWDDMLAPSKAEANLIWGKKGNLWYCYDRTKKGLAFSEGYDDAGNFENDLAYVGQGGKYGMIDVKGRVIVPCHLDSHLRLKGALDYMKKLGKESLNDADTYRLNIYGDETVNSFRITDQIPDDKWDY